jgi:DNA-binding transcriptional ArsR family regulator
VTTSASDGPAEIRVISDVETMRAMADPTRVAILRLLMTGNKVDPPIMSAKEIAAALSEPQVKLYRHLKHLAAVGLIRIAETRLVSGIQEARYQTGQRNLTIGGDLTTDSAAVPVLAETVTAVLREFHTGLARHLANDQVPLSSDVDTPLGMLMIRGMITRAAPDRATEFRKRLLALEAEFDALESDDPDGIPVQILLGWYVVTAPDSAGD